MSISKEAHDEALRRFGGTATGKPPSEGQRALNKRITGLFVELAAELEHELPAGREKATALTELKTAKMYAVDAIFTQTDEATTVVNNFGTEATS